MPEKDVDEQFAAIMARWDDEALGHDPYGDALSDAYARDDLGVDSAPDRLGDEGDGGSARPDRPEVRPEGRPELRPEVHPDFRSVHDLSDLRDWPVVNPAPDLRSSDAAPRPTADVGSPDDAVDDDGSDGVHSGARDWRPAHAPEDEHYVPPPPAPLPPSEDKHFWVMVAALVAGPLMFVYLLLFNRDGNGWWMMFALLVSIAGFVLLVLRQPLERDEDDDGIRL